MEFLKKLTISMKLGGAFGIVILMLVALASMSYIGLEDTYDGFNSYRSLARDTNLAAQLQADMLLMRMSVKDFLITGNQVEVDQYTTYLEKMHEALNESKIEFQQSERAALVKKISDEVDEFQSGFDAVVALKAQQTKLVVNQLEVSGGVVYNDIDEIVTKSAQSRDVASLTEAASLQEHFLLGRLFVNKYLDQNNPQYLERALREFGNAETFLHQLNGSLRNPQLKQLLVQVKENFVIYRNALDELAKNMKQRNEIIATHLDTVGPMIAQAAEDIKTSVRAEQDILGPQIKQETESIVQILIVGAVGAIFVAFLLSWALSRTMTGLTGMMTKLVRDLFTASDELTVAAGEISDSSQSLSSGAAEQAASLEETSSAMEQVAGQATNNAAGARQAAQAVDEMASVVSATNENAMAASGLATDARKASEKGVESMNLVYVAMREINEASSKVADILELINDITHQTKMLATNAAIEAARAGEQGKGFAVVADEVSTLAENSKKAAKEIAGLVKSAAEKARSGNDLAANGKQVLEEINGVSLKVAGLIDEIAGYAQRQAGQMQEVQDLVSNIQVSSDEQAKGVEEISHALTQMDEVTQTNAATAEEASAAAEELNSQAEALRNMVADVAKQFGVKEQAREARQVKRLALPHPDQMKQHLTKVGDKIKAAGRKLNPAEAIPIRPDFKGF